jgi:lipopolysaccharide export system permease protein
MIRVLQRHILSSVLFASGAAVVFTTFVFAAGNFIKELLAPLLDGTLPASVVLKLTVLLLPYAAVYAVPIGLLVGTLLVMGRLSADNEITAMRSAGLSLWQISRAVLMFGLCGAAFALAINFELMPRARTTYQVEIVRAFRQSAFNILAPKTFIRAFTGAVVYFNHKDGDELRDVWAWQLDGQQRVTRLIHAEAATLDINEDSATMVITFRNTTIEQRQAGNPEIRNKHDAIASFEETSIDISLARLFNPRRARHKIEWLPTRELFAELKRVSAPDIPSLDRLKVSMAVQEKFVTALAVFSFVLIGIPLGVRTQRKETSANLGIAVILVVVYHVLGSAAGGLDRHPELHPDLLMWLPNLLFVGLGLRLYHRAERA